MPRVKKKDKLTLFTIGCPNCEILKRALDKKKIKYDEITDRAEILDRKIYVVPKLQLEKPNGECELLDFKEAMDWVDKQ